MRKNILLLLGASALLFACNNTNKTTPEVVTETIDSTSIEVVDASNAQNALDYQGTYKGVLPTASGSGMEVTVVLGDSTYTKDISYIGEKDKLSSKGKYTWNKEGNAITLVGDEKPNQYVVGENTLTQLDVDGNKITGAIADQYILKK